jgi:hypothetical protein
MKQLIGIFILSILLAGCCGQSKYFEPNGIIDKTEEYKLNNKGWTSLKDKECVDGYTRIGDSIFGGEIACNVEPLKNIDIKTFKVLAGTLYAKDTNHVYYPLEIPCIDYDDCGVCYYGKVIIETANPETFSYLGKEYATDCKRVYFRGELMPNADGQTFKVVEGPEYFYFATDTNNVYMHNSVLENVDPSTFYFDKDDSRNIDREFEHRFIIGDKNMAWEYIPPDSIKEIEKK